jgi:hypothetical protein
MDSSETNVQIFVGEIEIRNHLVFLHTGVVIARRVKGHVFCRQQRILLSTTISSFPNSSAQAFAQGALAPRRLPEPPAESEAPRDRQRPPVTAVIIRRSIP